MQTEFGWHVILVEDRRPKDPPSFEQVAPQLTQELQGEAVESHIEGLRAGADIEVMEEAQPAAEEPAGEEAAPDQPSEGEAESGQ